MSATTVKLESAILREIRSVKPPHQSLSAYVREAIERDVMRRRMKEAAERYRALMDQHPGEAADLEEWEAAPLAAAPKRSRK
jgi:predicted transcriptional regulator